MIVLRGLASGQLALHFALAWLCAALSPATAQSGARTTQIPGGGLHFPYNAKIKVSRHELRIGVDAVRMSYTLSNQAASDHTILATFPMPELDMGSLVWSSLRLPVENDSNFVGLSISAGGKTLDPDLHQRARAMGIDVTQQLFQSNLPLFPFASGLSSQLDALPPDQQARFSRSGVIARIDNRWQPMWTLSSTLHWWLQLPPASPLTITASYKPISGTAAFSDAELARLKETHCLGARETDAIAKRVSAKRPISEVTNVTYSVASGANQLGPAESVRVVIELPAEAAIVVTCQDGFRRTGPLTLELAMTDAAIEDDIHVAFLK